VYKVEKKLKNSVTTVPIDDNKGFKKALVGSSPAFYATCLASPFNEDEMAHCGGNGIGTLLAAAEMEDDPAPEVIVIELHPGILSTAHNVKKATPVMICFRVDQYGNAFNQDMSIRDINEAIHVPLMEQGINRASRHLYLIRGSSLEALTLLTNDADLVFDPAPGRPEGTLRVHVAIEVVPVDDGSGKGKKRKAWDPFGMGRGHGGGGGDSGTVFGSCSGGGGGGGRPRRGRGERRARGDGRVEYREAAAALRVR